MCILNKLPSTTARLIGVANDPGQRGVRHGQADKTDKERCALTGLPGCAGDITCSGSQCAGIDPGFAFNPGEIGMGLVPDAG